MTVLGTSVLDSLFAGGPANTKGVNILAGQGVLKKGTILGRVRVTIPTTGTAGSNTGNGTITAVKGRKDTKAGVYTITASLALTLTTQNGVVFNVTNPDGKYLGSVACGGTTSETSVFNSPEIAFLVTNGSTDFANADSFTITVTEGVPNTGSAGSNTGTGTLINVRGGREVKVGTYTATCSEALTNSGKFDVTNPDGATIGSLWVSKYLGTGNGTITQKVAGKNKKPGLYLVTCTVALANGGTFTVTDPDGNIIGTIVLTVDGAHGSVPTYFYSDDISFKMTVGATDYIVGDKFSIDTLASDEITFDMTDGTDFIVGDSFTIAVTIGANDAKAYNPSNVDGSQYPDSILLEDVDATSVAVAAAALSAGKVVERELVFPVTDYDNRDEVKRLLRSVGIEVVGSVSRNAV